MLPVWGRKDHPFAFLTEMAVAFSRFSGLCLVQTGPHLSMAMQAWAML